jgi:hypothetical protein
VSVLLRQPYGFESIGAMAEKLQIVHFSFPDRPDKEEVERNRDAAFPPSATLANQSQDTIPGRLDELKWLHGQADPRGPELLQRLDEFCDAPKMLWNVRDRLLVVPVPLDLRIVNLGSGVPERPVFAPTERVKSVESVANDLDVLLRHRPRSIAQLQESA